MLGPPPRETSLFTPKVELIYEIASHDKSKFMNKYLGNNGLKIFSIFLACRLIAKCLGK
jgi:hypothetical protein